MIGNDINLKGTPGFKGERGYSAFEIAKQHGWVGTEEDWLAQLGTSNHIEECSDIYTATEGQTVFTLPDCYTSNSFVDIYVNGSRKNSDEYSIDSTNKTITLTSEATTGDKIEVVTLTMNVNNLPIVQDITKSSSNSSVISAEGLFNFLPFAKISSYGAVGDGLTDDTSAISNALARNGNNYSKIVFEGGIYKAKGTIYLYSNTELDLNGSTILDGESNYTTTIRDSGGLRFLNNTESMKTKGYGALKNIVIENGTFDGGTCGILFGLFHAQNVIIRNCKFTNCCMGTHIFDMGGCKGITFENCIFTGCTLTDQLNYREMIQLDYAAYTSIPYWGNNSSYGYDELACEDIIVKGCTFDKGSGTTYPNAIGTHGSREKKHTNIVIENNNFNDCTLASIRIPRVKNLYIRNNRFLNINTEVRSEISFILIEEGIYNDSGVSNENIFIEGNTFDYYGLSNTNINFIRIHGATALQHHHKNIIISNNVYYGTYLENTTAGNDFVQLGNVKDVIVKDNLIKQAKNFIHCVAQRTINDISVLGNRLSDCRTYTNATGTAKITNIYSKDNTWETSGVISVKQNKIFNSLYASEGSGRGDLSLSDEINNYDYILLSTGGIDNKTYTTIAVYPFNFDLGFRPGEDYLTINTATGQTVIFVKNKSTIEIISTNDLIRRIVGVKLI